MARIMAIDYGLKRTGLAVTDPLQIIATGLTTVESPQLITFLKDYFKREPVELILIGEPTNWESSFSSRSSWICMRVRVRSWCRRRIGTA